MVEPISVPSDTRSYRLTNIDALRGLVIIIMAIDHARDYFHLSGLQDPMNNPEIGLGLYLTRWVTHFCAPVFVFLAGTSVGLMENRRTKRELSAFVFKRGLWLIFIEIFILSTIISFVFFGNNAFGGLKTAPLQVLWALGASMVVLSGALYLGPRACMVMGLVIICFQNLLDPIWPQGSVGVPTTDYWIILYTQTSIVVEPFYHLFIAYPLLSWIGMMLLGYGTASVFQRPAEDRDKFLIRSGCIMIVLFFLIRALNSYGDPNSWELQSAGLLETILDFMNVSKYPASLLFFMITLGPMAILCAYADRWRGWFKDTLVMFGRVPFAFYLSHFFLLHVMAVIYGVLTGFDALQIRGSFSMYPADYGTGLVGVYVAWIIALAILYPFCKWMADIKKRRKDWWLSYL